MLGLFSKSAPKVVENFLELCDGVSKDENGKKLSYDDSRFFEVDSGRFLKGGDIEANDGSGGRSIFGQTFKPEKNTLSHYPFCVSMVTNPTSSQFLISAASLPELDGKYVVFGSVIHNRELVEEMVELTAKARLSI